MSKVKLAILLLSWLLIFVPQGSLIAQEEAAEKKVLDDIVVIAKPGGELPMLSPSVTTINIENYQMPGTAQSVLDIIKDQAVIDFRGQSDLVPGYDTIFMKGFEASRFTMAMDGMTMDYGGEAGFNVVDFGTLSLGQVEKIEIMPGPHSALFGGKSEGGVINIVTKKPERYTTTKPDVKLSTSYKNYNTQNHTVSVNGGVDSLFYGLSYQYYHTDGYLRNNEADISNYVAKLGYILPSDGYINFTLLYSDISRELVVANLKNSQDYDAGYPGTDGDRGYRPWQEPNKDQEQYTYRINFEQPHQYEGKFTLGAYYQDQEVIEHKNLDAMGRGPAQRPDEVTMNDWTYVMNQAGGRIQDEFRIAETHALTMGYDITHMWRPEDVLVEGARYKREHDLATLQGLYLQDKWSIFPRLTLTAGLRYEDVTFWRGNLNTGTGEHFITGKGDWIERNQNQVVPKSFLTYELDDLSKGLRDTSISAGVSKIWNPMPFCYNCGRDTPITAWVEPEHGIGYDFIFTRRLWKDIRFKADYSYYIIKDYVASNRGYAEYTPGRDNQVPPGLEYLDTYINLEEMQYQGIELGFTGHISDDLSFYLNYVYTDLSNQGNEPVGKEAEDERAEHRVNAGIRYTLFDNTVFMLDYKYQSEQIQQVSEEIGPDQYSWYTVNMDAYSLFDFAVEHTLFKACGSFKNIVAKFYINNLLDEEYVNSRGYPMTDRTFGVSLGCNF